MISSRDQRRIFLLPGKTRSVSESRLQDISTVIKQVQQNLPACRHPDSSRAYLVSGHDRIVQTSGRRTQSCPWWPPAADGLDQHLDKHWPGGLNKDDPRTDQAQGKRVGGEANGKGNVGPCWKSLIQSELSRGSHKSPDRVRDAKSGNITPI